MWIEIYMIIFAINRIADWKYQILASNIVGLGKVFVFGYS